MVAKFFVDIAEPWWIVAGWFCWCLTVAYCIRCASHVRACGHQRVDEDEDE